MASFALSLGLLLASFGVFLFIQSVIQGIYGAGVVSLLQGPMRDGHNVTLVGHAFYFVVTPVQVLIVSASWLLAGTTAAFVRYTRLGKAIRAVADDLVGANIVGIHAERIIAVVFFLGSVLAGAAGILISLETDIVPSMGLNAVMKAIIASIVGGIGSIPGALLGGLFLGLVENMATFLIRAQWKDTVAFAVLVIFLAIRPAGLLGGRQRGRL